jgi:transmembrane sensor
MTVDSIWLILGKKLNNEASADELEELDELLRNHPELHYPIQNITDLWRLKKKADQQEAINALQHHLLRIADEDGTISPFLQQYPQKRKAFVPHKRFWYAAAAITVIVISSIYLLFSSKPPPAVIAKTETSIKNSNEVSTRAGSHSKIVLPDGSSVWLNGGSKLIYDKNFDKEIREVELIGEAYFDVTKNPQRPFIIHTRKMDIKVLGTAFNVKSYPGDKSSETSLIHGSIEVTMKAGAEKKIILKPTEKLVITNDVPEVSSTGKAMAAEHPIIKVDRINYLPVDGTVIETSWVDNRLVFRDKPFSEIVVDMERRYGMPFRFENTDLGALMFSGNFKNESIDQVLKALQLANTFNYQNIRDTIVITK